MRAGAAGVKRNRNGRAFSSEADGGSREGNAASFQRQLLAVIVRTLAQ
jgi:hypothetical protein